MAGIPEVEMRHILDPLDQNFQRLAPTDPVRAERPREDAQEGHSQPASTEAVYGYQVYV